MATFTLTASSFRLVTKRDEKGGPVEFVNFVRGDELDLFDEAEIARLTKARAIAPVGKTEKIAPPVESTPDVEEGVPAPADRPHRNDIRAVWEAYAVSRGADPDIAAEATKAELIEEYGDK